MKEALAHSWDWFALHAGQRMQAVNFFLVSVGFLTSAYSVALNAKRPEVASGVAIFGALITFYFTRLEIRTRELVKASERPLARCEEHLAALTGVEELTLVKRVQTPKTAFSSYGDVIPTLQWTVFAGFILGMAFSIAVALTDDSESPVPSESGLATPIPISTYPSPRTLVPAKQPEQDLPQQSRTSGVRVTEGVVDGQVAAYRQGVTRKAVTLRRVSAVK